MKYFPTFKCGSAAVVVVRNLVEVRLIVKNLYSKVILHFRQTWTSCTGKLIITLITANRYNNLLEPENMRTLDNNLKGNLICQL